MNGDIEYTITSGDTSLFSINVDNGEFEVIGNIDRESQDYYELTIAATDKGTTISRMKNVRQDNDTFYFYFKDLCLAQRLQLSI